MPTPPHVPELVSALGDVLRDVCAPACRDDDFAYAQVLTAASITNYLTAELEQSGRPDEPSLQVAARALEAAADAIGASRPDVASAMREAAALPGGRGVAESLSEALEAVRSVQEDRAANDARWILRRALADLARDESAMFAAAEPASPPRRT